MTKLRITFEVSIERDPKDPNRFWRNYSGGARMVIALSEGQKKKCLLLDAAANEHGYANLSGVGRRAVIDGRPQYVLKFRATTDLARAKPWR